MIKATTNMDTIKAPDIDAIKAARIKLGEQILTTPVWHWQSDLLRERLDNTNIHLKLECLQYAGSFKPRGALMVMHHLDRQQLDRGVTAVSAGNHAIAVGYAAKVLGTSAKVVMPKTANPFRVETCKRYGCEVILADDVHHAFTLVKEIEQQEGRYFVHPFEGPMTVLGTATLGYEWVQQCTQPLDAVIIPIGGGGLCAGVSCAIKQLWPSCQVFAVEPSGANTMHLSFAENSPQSIDKVNTIADSLGAPHAAPYSFELCKTYVDQLVMIEDQDMTQAMQLLFNDMKLAIEPAGAAATAALFGPLRKTLSNKSVGIIICGSNIDLKTYQNIIINN